MSTYSNSFARFLSGSLLLSFVYNPTSYSLAQAHFEWLADVVVSN